MGDKGRRTLCHDCCELEAKTFLCQLCGSRFTSDGFTEGMWRNKGSDQRMLCKGCCRPPCTNAECFTCKNCRDPTCTKRRRCEVQFTSLNPKCLPETVEELKWWLCAKCKPKFCSNWL